MDWTYWKSLFILTISLPLITIIKFWDWLKWVNKKVTDAGPSLRAWLSLSALFFLPVTIFLLWDDFQKIRASLVPIELELGIVRDIDKIPIFEYYNNQDYYAEDVTIGQEFAHLNSDKKKIIPLGGKSTEFKYIKSHKSLYSRVGRAVYPVYGKMTLGCKNCKDRTYVMLLDTTYNAPSFYFELTDEEVSIDEGEYFKNPSKHLKEIFSKYKIQYLKNRNSLGKKQK